MRYFYLLILMIVIPQLEAKSCTCGSIRTVEDEYENVDYVLYAKVLDKEIISDVDSAEYIKYLKEGRHESMVRRFTQYGYTRYKIVLINSYKGTFAQDTIDVFTACVSSPENWAS